MIRIASRLLLLCTLVSALPAAEAQGQPAARTTSATSFVPADFDPPRQIQAPRFRIVPLGPQLVDIDYRAYMSSIDHLQKTFSRSADWPRLGITHAEAMQDMETEQARFAARRSFAYAVLTPDATREIGSIYVQPSPVAGYDAVVRMWVTKADYDAGFDPLLFAWVGNWMKNAWPFRRIAYPGRTIDWASWDRLVAANAAKSK